MSHFIRASISIPKKASVTTSIARRVSSTCRMPRGNLSFCLRRSRPLDAICDSLHRELEAQSIDASVLIPAIIHDVLRIHPFSDGNGRMRCLPALPQWIYSLQVHQDRSHGTVSHHRQVHSGKCYKIVGRGRRACQTSQRTGGIIYAKRRGMRMRVRIAPETRI